MKIVMLSKALLVGAYQKKLEELARLPGVELVALVPPTWHEPGAGVLRLERRFTQGYRMEMLPLVLNGQHHLYWFAGLGRALRRERPDVLHIDEESFNLATYQAMRLGVVLGARCCFYNWANIERRYPPPFGWFERYNFRHAAHAIAGNHDAAAILRRHGYQGPLTLLPQFGVDPDLFAPAPPRPANGPLVVGYLGRLVAQKGLLDLLDALTLLPPHIRLRLVGSGDLRPRLEQRARERGLTERIELWPAVPSTDVPEVLRGLDVLALPSHTTPNWKEQFGRVLIEAMSCGVPVVGSSSGEIANVVGAGGLIVPERSPRALANALRLLAEQPALRRELGQRGRARVLAHYTQAALARSYYAVYREML
jgi:glycosyltransferase involved in cell wall biosynthesis